MQLTLALSPNFQVHCQSRRQRAKHGGDARHSDDIISDAPNVVKNCAASPVSVESLGRVVDVELNTVQIQCA